ncbi:MAG: hypothetical protein AMXMBFR23_03040 [Chloroflexota bacterium]
MERHEIPTHLEVADRAFLGLTMRQLLSAAVGLALAYGTLADLPLPFGLRLALAVVVVVATAVLVLWRPGGRPAEEWVFVLLRYGASPRLAVWRPQGRDTAERAIREVIIPATPHEADAWKERVDAT